jgi:hypothetical protein
VILLDEHFFFFFTILGFELRALHLLGRCSITPNPFCFIYFSSRVSCFCPGLVSDHDPPTYGLPCLGLRTCITTLFYLLKWCLANFFPKLASNCDPLDLCLLSSRHYRHEPLAGIMYSKLLVHPHEPNLSPKKLLP